VSSAWTDDPTNRQLSFNDVERGVGRSLRRCRCCGVEGDDVQSEPCTDGKDADKCGNGLYSGSVHAVGRLTRPA
jgi:hypothetical protein